MRLGTVHSDGTSGTGGTRRRCPSSLAAYPIHAGGCLVVVGALAASRCRVKSRLLHTGACVQLQGAVDAVVGAGYLHNDICGLSLAPLPPVRLTHHRG